MEEGGVYKAEVGLKWLRTQWAEPCLQWRSPAYNGKEPSTMPTMDLSGAYRAFAHR